MNATKLLCAGLVILSVFLCSGDFSIADPLDNGNNTFVAVEGNGAILQSDPVTSSSVFPGYWPDFDGDGKTDIAVWRPSNGCWFIIHSSGGNTTYTQWGAPNDIPVSL